MRMLRNHCLIVFLFLFLSHLVFIEAQSTSGSVNGTVTDPSGALIAGASVQISNPVSGYTRTAVTDTKGQFQFFNIPFNPYRLTVTVNGLFAAFSQTLDVSSVVPVSATVKMSLEGASTSVTVETGGDLAETDSNFHTDVDRMMIDKMPLESASSSLSSIVTLSSPGVSADSNRAISRVGRSCGELLFGGRTADYRSAKQGFFKPAAGGCGAVADGD